MFNYFDYFNRGYIFGVKTDKYKPYINYTWVERPNGQVQNIGSSGQDLQLYSGNPLDFQATQGIQVNKSFTLSGNAISLFLGFDTDSIAITQTLAEFDNLKVSIANATLKVTINAVEHNVATIALNTYYQTEIVINSNNLTVKLNVTQTYSASCTTLNTTILKSVGANDGLASGRFDGQFDYFIAYNGLTTFSLPNQFFKDMSTNSNTLFCTDFIGNLGYIADSKNYSKQLVSDGTVNVLGSYWSYDGSILTRVYSAGAYSNTYMSANITAGKTYLLKHKFLNFVSGSYNVQDRIGNYYAFSVKPSSVDSDGFYRLIFVAKSSIDSIGFRTGDLISSITDWSLEELSGVYPITNYSATQRTNFTQESKGLQDLTRLFDSNGFFLDNTDYLNCNGKGKAAVIEPSRTSKVTIQTNPTILSGNILSGGVTLTTAGLTVGIDNNIVLDNQAISSNIDIGVGYKGKVTIYKEDLL